MSSNYSTKKKSNYSDSSTKQNNYSINSSTNKVTSYVSNNQVKEKKGICTCKKKGPCRGTCRL